MLQYHEQQYYLNAMGLPQWQLRDTEVPVIEDDSAYYVPSGLYDLDSFVDTEKEISASSLKTDVPDNVPDVVEEKRELEPELIQKQTPSIVSEQVIDKISQKQEQAIQQPTQLVQPVEIVSSPQLFASLANKISSCKLCSDRLFGQQSLKIQLLRKSTHSNKNILLLVSSPTAEEYQQGAFMGKNYSPLMNAIFRSVDLDATIYMSSIIKCIESDLYSALDKEIIKQDTINCLPFLKQELESINAHLIVTMGPIALNYLAEKVDKSLVLEENIGQTFKVKKSLVDNNIPLLTTFHPAFLYRNPLFKAKALQHWIDIARIIKK